LRHYAQQIAALQRAIDDGTTEGRIKLADSLRRPVATVTVCRRNGGTELEISGFMTELLDGPTFTQGSRVGGTLVAEEGFEPPTHGL
jgi:site-specific DNA recombinase